MNKIMMVAKKLALLTVMVLPLVSLADNVSPAWDERVMVPVFKGPEWLLCGSVFAGFVVVSALMFVVMRRKGRPIMEFAVLETMIAAGLTVLLIWCKGLGFSYEERVIHHPEERPNHRYGPEKIQVKCRECGKEYTTTVTHYGGGTQREDDGLCQQCWERHLRESAAAGM